MTASQKSSTDMRKGRTSVTNVTGPVPGPAPVLVKVADLERMTVTQMPFYRHEGRPDLCYKCNRTGPRTGLELTASQMPVTDMREGQTSATSVTGPVPVWEMQRSWIESDRLPNVGHRHEGRSDLIYHCHRTGLG